MADTKPATKPFQHDGKPVFVLIPQNPGYSKICQDFLAEAYPKLEAEVCTEIRVKQLPPDCVLYVMHPIKEKKKDTRQKLRSVISTYISPPVDVFKSCASSSKNGYRTINQNLLAQTVTQLCNNDPAGLFFRGCITSESKKNPDALLLKITEQ